MSSISEEADPSENRAAARNTAAGPVPSRVTFNRLELNRILNLYGRMVAEGEWRETELKASRLLRVAAGELARTVEGERG